MKNGARHLFSPYKKKVPGTFSDKETLIEKGYRNWLGE